MKKTDDLISRHAAIIEMMDNGVDHAQGTDGREVVQILSDIPAADVVPVVRCKDCKYRNDGNVLMGCYWDIDGGQPQEMDFCSRGKRREE